MDEARPLRRGWTTGACATAASKAAFTALLTGEFPDPVEITLAWGQSVAFALAVNRKDAGSATAGVIKDAGDDPDVTHGALVLATVRKGAAGSGVSFKAGPGVGTVTLPGLARAAGRARDQSRAAQDDARGDRGGGERAWPRGRCRDRDLHSPWRGDGGEDAQCAARHPWRAVDPRHHRRGRSLFLRGVDRIDPSRHRRRAGHWARRMWRPRRGAHRKPPSRRSTICQRRRCSIWAISSAAR